MMRVFVLCVCALVMFGATAGAQTEKMKQIEELLNAGKGAEARAIAEELVKTAPDEPMSWFLLARSRHADGDLDAAIETGRRAVEFPGVRASSYYNLACAYALSGRPDKAFDALRQAKRAGFADRVLMRTDADLQAIRTDPRFVLPVERRFDVLDVGDRIGLPYSIDLPVNFDADKSYPILFGPGSAEPNPVQGGSLFWGEDACQRGWIVVESPAFLMADPEDKTRRLLDHIAATYKPEGGKFHIAGFSANATGAFAVAIALPERFHSVSGVPGHPIVDGDAALERLKGVIVNMIVGETDEFWLGEARGMHERLKLLGVESHIEVIPGGGHVLQELFGGEFMDRLDELRRR